MPEKHALLGASGAHIWLNCTPSPRAAEHVPDAGSEYAAEGTLAHAIGELKLRKHFTEPMGERTYKAHLNKLKKDPLFNKEMLNITDGYLDFVKELSYNFPEKPHVAVEQQVNFGDYVPEGFGTCDCIIVGSGVLHVVDLKYGKGVPVYADHNPQIMLYAVGAFLRYSLIFPIQTVRMTIYQPRLENVSTFEMPVSDLLAWAESIKPTAQAAFMGIGEMKPGNWCQFCRIRETCRVRAEKAMDAIRHANTVGANVAAPAELSIEEVAALLTELNDTNAVKWAKQLESYALKKVLDGENVPGWKAVEGRTSRSFKDFSVVAKKLLDNGYKRAMIYRQEPETLTGIERLLGKAKFNEILAEDITKAPGKPTLVPESDPREAFHRATAADDFKDAPVEPQTAEPKTETAQSAEKGN